MHKNDLSFGEEFVLDQENALGEKDEVAILLCALCGLGMVAGCILCGCEIPFLFGVGAAAFNASGVGTMATAAGAVTPL